ncbi:unnamed protein product [Xylocopa violacea]|uniref:Uncharacterized protein n=1 Tax=Xylocopa violacea TaxID=135666 RepID=A0ABP1N6U1_XYLVO
MPGPGCDKCSDVEFSWNLCDMGLALVVHAGSNGIIYSSNAITGNAQLMSLSNLSIISANNANAARNANAATPDAEINALANLANNALANPASAKLLSGH